MQQSARPVEQLPQTIDAVAGAVGPDATITPSYGAFARTGLA